MKKPLVLILSLSLVAPMLLSACGVKSNLVMPDGKETPKGTKDPSKPPNPNNENP